MLRKMLFNHYITITAPPLFQSLIRYDDVHQQNRRLCLWKWIQSILGGASKVTVGNHAVVQKPFIFLDYLCSEMGVAAINSTDK